MKTNTTVDTAKLSLLLNELRLPAIKLMWPQFAEQADKEGWPAARFLAAITEHDRLVHHATIFEMNVESYRRREVMERKCGPGRPASYATPANSVAD
ncbi:hypothetical protein MPL3356_10011 [Mesorhizobium plurifarium]|uniref:Uncharacterized protein n=1 Tax=Mesorhizobium plurifarium TaxID=69974 RepID=A0A090D938_MESPL|nr:hypothetical protein MPL3356_10011 [Mesorhizobium plurifarium]